MRAELRSYFFAALVTPISRSTSSSKARGLLAMKRRYPSGSIAVPQLNRSAWWTFAAGVIGLHFGATQVAVMVRIGLSEAVRCRTRGRISTRSGQDKHKEGVSKVCAQLLNDVPILMISFHG